MNTIALIGDYGKVGGIRTYFKQLLDFFVNHATENNISKVIVFFYQDQFDTELKSLISKSDILKPIILPHIFQMTLISKIFRKLNLLDWYEFQFEKLTINKILKYKPNAVIYSISNGTKFLYSLTKKTPSLIISHTLINGSPIQHKYRLKAYNDFKINCNPKSRICSVSEIGKNIFEKWMPVNKDIKLYTVFPNHCGFSTDIVSNKPHKQITILTLGLLETFKNPDLWIKIAKNISDKFISNNKIPPNFIWAGNGSFYEHLLSESKEYQNIKFIGFQSNTSVLYENADIYVQPSLTENCCLSVIEAMKYGLPCIVSNIGGLPEQIQNNYNGILCNLNNPEEFENAILELIKNKKLRQTYGKNSRKVFDTKYTQDKWNKNFSTLLSEILN